MNTNAALPVIPETITVHLGRPTEAARNLTLPFLDYVANVASSEIYPTWPDAALRANIYAQVSFALNRIYTEFYRSRGYDFDITNSTAIDQAFVEGREIFSNIRDIAAELFNSYVTRGNSVEPYFTQYCDGDRVQCEGLSQWGTVSLANNGLSVLEILRYYYPKDLILSNAPTGVVQNSYPGTPLRLGSSGTDVRRIQTYLNRIHQNFPLIPLITPVDGSFGTRTQEAVRVFQRTFNLTSDGVVGVGTWNKISQIYTAVTGLAELNGEGERIGVGNTPPTTVLRQGSRGNDVLQLQFLLNYIAQFYPTVPSVSQDSVFGANTSSAVRSFQRQFGLTQDGVVGRATWNKLYQVYQTLQSGEAPSGGNTGSGSGVIAWPGVYFRQGSTGGYVATLQNLLNNARKTYAQLPLLTVDGVFGANTNNAVRLFQRAAGLAVDGIVGPSTWNSLALLAR